MSPSPENLSDPPPVLIAGPTASGKSALALELAERLGGIVINADSMQVYRELAILTARPTAADLARAPHALYGFVPAREAYSAGRFVSDAARAIADAKAGGLRPIIVGGTGLYFKALLEGLAPVPAIDESVRAHWRAEAERVGAETLHARLAEKDAEMAGRLHPSDTQRIVRALEVFDSTGRSLASWQALRGTPVIDASRAVRLLLNPERTELHVRADRRFDRMIEEGALAEAAKLESLQLASDLPAMRAIGVAPLLRVVRGAQSLDSAAEDAKAETRQYIKRQQTWLKSNMITWSDITQQYMQNNAANIVTFIQS